jgi:hypothetical protein
MENNVMLKIYREKRLLGTSKTSVFRSFRSLGKKPHLQKLFILQQISGFLLGIP